MNDLRSLRKLAGVGYSLQHNYAFPKTQCFTNLKCALYHSYRIGQKMIGSGLLLRNIMGCQLAYWIGLGTHLFLYSLHAKPR